MKVVFVVQLRGIFSDIKNEQYGFVNCVLWMHLQVVVFAVPRICGGRFGHLLQMLRNCCKCVKLDNLMISSVSLISLISCVSV